MRGLRWVVVLGALVWAGCDEGGTTALPPANDAGPGQGGAPGAGGDPGAGGEPGAGGAGGAGGAPGAGGMGGEPGAGGVGGAPGAGGMGGEPGVGGGMGGEPGVGGGMGGEPGMGGDGGGGPGDAITAAQVAPVGFGASTFVAWAEDATLHLDSIDAEGNWVEGETVDLPYAPTWVAGQAVQGTPWVAFGAAGQRIGALQADRPDLVLSLDVEGRPVLAAADDDLLVAGLVGDALAWQLVGVDDEQGDLIAPTFGPEGVGAADDAMGQTGGVILRFDADGQCLQLDASGRGLGNFPCRRAAGRFIGNGSRIFTAYIDDATFNIRVGALFDTEGGFGIGRIETVNLVDFATVDGARPVVTVRNIEPDVGRLQLRVATVDALWESDATWLTWPWQDARAVVPRGDTAYVVRFDGGPALETLALTERDFGAEPVYRLDVDDQCPPSVERCDGVDQDCDGRADDGLCCTQDDRRIDAVLQSLEGAPREFLITSVENGDAYRVAVRVAEDAWQLYITSPRADPAMTSAALLKEMGLPNSQARIAGAHEGRAFVAAGGYNLLLANDGEGRLTAFWHRDRLVCPPDMPGCEPGQRTTDFKAPFPVPCERVLAVDVIDHTTDNASALLACGDGLHRLYARSEVQDRFWSYRELDIDVDGVDWVTITRQAEDVSTLLVGYESSLGSPTLSSLFFVANANGPPQLRAVDANLLQQGELLRDPVWLPTALGAPPVRIAEGNAEVMLREGRGEQLRVTWLPVQTGAVDAESQFAITTSLVVTAAATEPLPGEAQATGFWMVDVRGDNGLNLWSTEPSVVLPGPKPLWRVIQHPARILQPAGVVPRDLETFATVEPDGDTWRLRTYRVDCRPL